MLRVGELFLFAIPEKVTANGKLLKAGAVLCVTLTGLVRAHYRGAKKKAAKLGLVRLLAMFKRWMVRSKLMAVQVCVCSLIAYRR